MATPLSQHDQLLHTNTVVLANALTLASEVILSIVGNDVASSLNQTPLTHETVNALILARVMASITPA